MHRPVLLDEAVEMLAVRPGGTYVDGTVGAGGHAAAILRASEPHGVLLGLDRDVAALERAARTLAPFGERCMLVHSNLADMAEVAEARNVRPVDGVLADLGMSSDQVDEPERGFSFQQDGPLDMRMDPTRGETAAEMLRRLTEEDLTSLLRNLGEERSARRIARAIVEERERTPIERTVQLAELVERVKGGRRGRIHPATQTFMALRMAVNREMESLEQGLEAAIRLVRPGGRVAVISFHSIEDRMVKHHMARHVGRDESLAAGGSRWVGEEPRARWVQRRMRTASPEEIRDNPRARSAKLRAIERIDGT